MYRVLWDHSMAWVREMDLHMETDEEPDDAALWPPANSDDSDSE